MSAESESGDNLCLRLIQVDLSYTVDSNPSNFAGKNKLMALLLMASSAFLRLNYEPVLHQIFRASLRLSLTFSIKYSIQEETNNNNTRHRGYVKMTE